MDVGREIRSLQRERREGSRIEMQRRLRLGSFWVSLDALWISLGS